MEESSESRKDHYQLTMPWKQFPPHQEYYKLLAQHRLNLSKKRLETDNVANVGERLHNAAIESDAKYPVILPKKPHIFHLIIRSHQNASEHSGLECSLSLIG